MHRESGGWSRLSASATLLLAVVACGAAASQTKPADAPADEEQHARVTCGGCHAFPPPETLPRAAWRDEFVRMMFIRENRVPPVGPSDVVYRSVKLPADMEKVLPYFLSRAPERLPLPEPWPDPAKSPLTFARHTLTIPGRSFPPAVSNVRIVDFDGDNRLDVLATEMREGFVFTGPATGAAPLSIVASIPNPAHVTWTDVDGDDVQDLLVADLGGFFPEDHEKGTVIWLRGLANRKFAAIWLDGWPRVADVEAADFNGDGKKDLAVAAFGWRKTGRVAILENRTTNPSRPDFTPHVVDPRPGGIHVIPVDLNRDGHMDLITLLAQEHETVLAYINKGTRDFAFEQKVIYAAPHPNWGSSGIQIVDLDKDGDVDVLLTHGDSFDDGIVKPYHGVQWLENRGGYPFVEHTLAQMPGVHRADAADLDGDGDLDVVACALLAAGANVDESTLPALVWLEQTRPGTFVRHTIEMGFPRHATLDLGDVDRDGDVDIVVGNFSLDRKLPGLIDVWTNQSKPKISTGHDR